MHIEIKMSENPNIFVPEVITLSAVTSEGLILLKNHENSRRAATIIIIFPRRRSAAALKSAFV